MAQRGRRAQLREADRKRLEEYEQEGFVPVGAWRSVTARIDAMEHAMLVKMAAGAPILRIHRPVAWLDEWPVESPEQVAARLREAGIVLPDTFGPAERLVITP